MSSELRGRERRDFWVLTLAQFLMFCGFFSFFQFPLFIKSVGGHETAIGVMGGLGAFAATLFIPWIADFVNSSERKRLMQIGMGITAVTTLGSLTMTAPDAWMAALLILRGLGFALYNNAAGAYIAEILPASERSRWIGMNFGFNQIAVAVGPALAELFITHVGFASFFLMSAGFTLAAMALLTRVTTRPPRMDLPRLNPLRVGQVFFSTLTRRETRYLYLTLLLMACGLGAVFNFTATYVKGMGLSSGVFFTMYALVNGGSRMGGGGLSDRYGRAVIVVPTLGLFCVGLLIYSVTGGIALMAVSALFIGLGFGLSNPAILAQLLDRTGRREQGRVIGGFHFAYQLGALCSTPGFGAAAESLGYPAMWRIAGSIVLASTLVYALAEGRRGGAARGDAVSGEAG
jgi:MFS family permease